MNPFGSGSNRLLFAFIVDFIIQLICPFLIGFLAGFFITLTILSKNYKHTKYYKHRIVVSSLIAVILGVISSYALFSLFFNISSYFFSAIGWPN